MANVHNGIFVERIRRTQHVESFRFRFTPPLAFVPGQFAQLVFDASNPANRDVNKYLSFSSSPQRDYCEVTKRLTDSAFSRRLQALKEGDTVLFKAPLGSCVLKDEYRQLCFLIGGIGITPVISMLEYIIDRDLPTDAVVFYSNRNETDIAFKPELDAWCKRSAHIKVYYTVTDCQPHERGCLRGAIDTTMVASRIADVADRFFYMMGPPKMVEAMKHVCAGIGCSPDRIKMENFVGY